VTVSVENLGGIEATTVTVPAGITVLTGENATNRTSFLRSLAAVLGGRESAASLKSDAEAGRVELSTDEGTYARVYGEAGVDEPASSPLTDQPELVDGFVAIDERNPARRAIRGGGGGIRELLMAPVDTDAIRASIRETRTERSDLEAQLERIEARQSELPGLRERRSSIESELEAVESELASVQADIEAADTTGEDAEDLADLRAERSRIREAIGETERTLERQRDRVASLETELESIESELAAIEVEADRLADIEDRIEGLERRKRELEGFANDLAAVLEVNRDLLADDFGAASGRGDVTAALDPSGRTIECWTCGSEVERAQVTDRLDSLRERLESTRAERDEIEAELEELREAAAEIEREKRRREQLEADRRDVEAERELRTQRIEEARAELAGLREELEDLESAVEADAGAEGDLASAYERLSDLEYERGRLVEERSTVASEIAEIERLVEEDGPRVQERIDALSDELEELRGRVADIETSVIETFDEHMNELLDRLAYRNVERVWLERRVGEREDPLDESEFVLHVVREGPDGAVYEDTVETLSESERELIGIVLALAGYLVHDVGDSVPFVLLDSVEAIDADRLGSVLAYVGEQVPYVLAAVLPEEAAALPDRYSRIPADELADT
jgi:DNA repair ATPase RecN